MLKLHTVQCNFKSYLSYLLSAPYLYDSMPVIYLCKFCKSSFKNILAVKRHIFKDHLKNECGEVNVKLYCTIDNCGEQLNSASALRKHRFRHHKGKQWTVPTNWYQCMSGCSSLPADEVDILVPKENNINKIEVHAKLPEEDADINISVNSRHTGTCYDGHQMQSFKLLEPDTAVPGTYYYDDSLLLPEFLEKDNNVFDASTSACNDSGMQSNELLEKDTGTISANMFDIQDYDTDDMHSPSELPIPVLREGKDDMHSPELPIPVLREGKPTGISVCTSMNKSEILTLYCLFTDDKCFVIDSRNFSSLEIKINQNIKNICNYR